MSRDLNNQFPFYFDAAKKLVDFNTELYIFQKETEVQEQTTKREEVQPTKQD